MENRLPVDEPTRQQMHQWLAETASGVAGALGATAHLAISPSQPVTENDPACAQRAFKAAGQALGAEGAVWLPEGALTAEDFSRYCREIPSAFIWLGAGWPAASGRIDYPLHHPQFDFPEEALGHGVTLLSLIALDALGLEPFAGGISR